MKETRNAPGEEPELKTTRIRDPVISADLASNDPILKDDRIARISSSIRVIPDFPKPGIMFQDITTLLLDTKAFKDTIDLFVERYKDKTSVSLQVLKQEVLCLVHPLHWLLGQNLSPGGNPRNCGGRLFQKSFLWSVVQAGARALVVSGGARIFI
ncbi:adenine phosphoribosyltransferase 1 [Nicotiana attenuata]|uniref:adenine phosphoribosyltransferase n=1 Tax=Nicotiana attenuata TaxID=49451 RepID=A0A1J6JNR5_NICAT|nr:adenine phosphoribosyltransferase 1 [Nicotiana attenuata]